MKSLDSVKILNTFLANTYTLYLKYQNYHWNVVGEQFYSLHNLFEDNYKSLADIVDEVAERIRACGAKPIATFEEFLAHSNIKSGNSNFDHKTMINDLSKDHEYIISHIQSSFKVIEEDIVTVDMMTKHSNYHQETLWMLRSTLS